MQEDWIKNSGSWSMKREILIELNSHFKTLLEKVGFFLVIF